MNQSGPACYAPVLIWKAGGYSKTYTLRGARDDGHRPARFRWGTRMIDGHRCFCWYPEDKNRAVAYAGTDLWGTPLVQRLFGWTV